MDPSPGEPHSEPPPADTDRQVYVGGLPWGTEERDLQAEFEAIGTVTDVKVIYDRETGRSRGYGFVTFEDAKYVSEAIEKMDGREIGGRTIKVNRASGGMGGRDGPRFRDRDDYGGGGAAAAGVAAAVTVVRRATTITVRRATTTRPRDGRPTASRQHTTTTGMAMTRTVLPRAVTTLANLPRITTGRWRTAAGLPRRTARRRARCTGRIRTARLRRAPRRPACTTTMRWTRTTAARRRAARTRAARTTRLRLVRRRRARRRTTRGTRPRTTRTDRRRRAVPWARRLRAEERRPRRRTTTMPIRMRRRRATLRPIPTALQAVGVEATAAAEVPEDTDLALGRTILLSEAVSCVRVCNGSLALSWL